jgi:hypothetical protein
MKSFLAKFAAVAVVAAIGLPGVASASRGGGQQESQESGRCTGRPFELVKVSDLAVAEKARAEKVNRNGNDFVCRMDIPGRGGGNTGNNSNIKDDKI